MSILSVAWHRLFDKHDDPAQVWSDTKAQITQWEDGIAANVPTAVQPLVSQLVSDVKQGLSNGIADVEGALPGIVNQYGPALDDIFQKVVDAYCGPLVGNVLSAAEVDARKRVADWIINHVKGAQLTNLAAATGVAAQPAPTQVVAAASTGTVTG
jgi:hypothetical protein